MRAGFLNPFEDLSSTSDDEKEDDEDEEEDEEDDEEDEEDEGEVIDDDEIDETKIPYDIRMDTMAYMTCNSPRSYSNDEFFHFKIGALHRGGIRIHPSFTKTYGNSISDMKQYPYYKASPFVTFVKGYNGTSTSSNFFFDFPTDVETLNHHVLRTLIDEPNHAYLKSINGEPLLAKFITEDSQHLIDYLDEDKYKLLVGFKSNSYSYKFHKYEDPEDNEVYIHGRYYKVHKEKKSTYIHVLDRVEEIYPAPRKIDSDWNCDYQYKVLRHSDDAGEDETLCPEVKRPESPSTEYLLVERVLKNESGDEGNWNINIEADCISPKTANPDGQPRCYYYTSSNSRNTPITKVTESGCSYGDPDNFCPHYLSICILGDL